MLQARPSAFDDARALLRRGGLICNYTVGPEQPAVIFDEPNAQRTVCIERLDIDFLRDESPATLVLKSSATSRYSGGSY